MYYKFSEWLLYFEKQDVYKDENIRNLILQAHKENPNLNATRLAKIIRDNGHNISSTLVSYVINKWKKTAPVERLAKIKPSTYEPKTYEPKTYEPKTYEPKTYEPKTYEPKTYEPTPEMIYRSYAQNQYSKYKTILSLVKQGVTMSRDKFVDIFDNPQKYNIDKWLIDREINGFVEPEYRSPSGFGHGTGGGRRIARSSRNW